ncbi:DUF1120 domain-containing protein [Pseudomonas sp. W22_MBD1_FP4]|jgi:hypothetical protein|uniref:DUF1120 domain-containing protein n=1 Tax=Pseudomonas sp. W22_MBD1_FP4 TaxID=3240272 RepID=UPI003F95CDE0
MNKSLTLLSSVLLLANALPTFAASSVDMTVTGVITPSACTPSLPGAVDFGKISAKDLNADAQTRLPDQTIKLSVSCEGSTLFAITPFDNRTGSSTQNSAFGLGLINDTEKLGRYYLSMRNPVADVASTLLSTRGEGRWGELYDDDAVVPNALIALGSFDATNGWLPHPLQDMSVEVVLNTAIAPAKSLTLTNEVQLDGSATFEVKYL